jgi:putative flippase GtrA
MVDEPAPPILRPGLRRDDRNGSLPSEFDVTVVIPTRNETGNVEELLRRLDAALGSLRAEVLFVDDSDDDTPSVIRDAADKSSRPVRLLHREPGRRAGRLGGAVVAGFQLARAPWAVVIDGDLQHPPEMIPSLIGRASPDVDLVYGTRYVDSGDAGGLNGRGREWVSAASTALAKAVFPRKLRAVSDPMSGFFAVRLGALDLSALRPAGYKVLLEILAQSRLRATAGVAYSFQPRFSGQSKASLIEGARFLVQLVALRLGMSVGRLAQIAAFLAVGLSGVAVNTLALWSLSAAWFDLPYLLAAFLATNIAIAWNFVLLETWVFRRVRRRSFAAGFRPLLAGQRGAVAGAVGVAGRVGGGAGRESGGRERADPGRGVLPAVSAHLDVGVRPERGSRGRTDRTAAPPFRPPDDRRRPSGTDHAPPRVMARFRGRGPAGIVHRPARVSHPCG